MKLLQYIKENYMTELEKEHSREMEYLTFLTEKNQVEIKIIGKMMSKIYEILLTKNDAKN